MQLREIQQMWDEDSEIPSTNLVNQSLGIPRLHAKYYRVYMQESMQLAMLKDEVKILKFKKHCFLTEGPGGDFPKEWELPPRGRILKAEVDRYIETDPEVIELTQRLQLQIEKTKFVESIIASLTQRGFAIKNAIDVMKFEAGN